MSNTYKHKTVSRQKRLINVDDFLDVRKHSWDYLWARLIRWKDYDIARHSLCTTEKEKKALFKRYDKWHTYVPHEWTRERHEKPFRLTNKKILRQIEKGEIDVEDADFEFPVNSKKPHYYYY